MKCVIEEFKNKFEDIKKLGFVKSAVSDFGGVGKTIESLLKIDSNYKPTADYKGIEIKAKCHNSVYGITLFSILPKCSDDNILDLPTYLKDKFGYKVKSNSNDTLYDLLFAHKIVFGKGKYSFFLVVNKECEKIYMYTFDRNYRLVCNNFFWSFSDIREKLENKMQYLAYIKAKATKLDDSFYYKYESLTFYKLKSFDAFIDAIIKGDIFLRFNIGAKSNNETSYHGIRFVIREEDLSKIYSKIEYI